MVDMYCITASNATRLKIEDYMNNSNKQNVSSFIDGLIHLINKSNIDNYISISCGKVSITIRKEADIVMCPEYNDTSAIEAELL